MAKLSHIGQEFKEKNPEKFKILCEAMEETHGKVDNVVAEVLMESTNATKEDIIRLAGSFNRPEKNCCGYYDHGRNRFWHKVEKRTKEDIEDARRHIRKERFEACRKYKFRDSFLYRAMVKMGMNPSENDGDWCGAQTYYTNPGAFGYGSGNKLCDTKYAEVTVMYMRAGEDLRRSIMESKALSSVWTEQARVRRNVDSIYNSEEKEKNPISFTDDEWRRFQSDHIIKEFGWLAKMPEDVKKNMEGFIEDGENNSKRGYWRREKLPPTLTNTILNAFRYPSTDKNVELVREAYQVMEYLGIGVCWNYVERVKDDGENEYRDVYSNQKATGVGGMLKKVSSMMRRFSADMRKGYSPEDVRELIVEDLNSWAATKVGNRWMFYPRTDAPSEYEGFTKKKKPATEKVKLFRSNRNLELDENDPEDVDFLNVLNKLENNNNEEDNNNDDEATEN